MPLTQRLNSPEEAGELLASRLLVAFPTETVFGLGAMASDDETLRRLFAAKGRPSDNPLIVHLADVHQWSQAAQELPESAQLLLDAFSPGPLTVVLPKHPSISSLVTAGLDTVAVRIPSCEVTRRVLRTAAGPIAAPSANRSGRPSCTTWESVWEDMEGRIDAVLCVNVPSIGLESTVVDCTGKLPVLLRPGAVSLEQLQSVVAETTALDRVNALANSPGLRHPHYRPRAAVKLIRPLVVGNEVAETDLSAVAYCGLSQHPARRQLKLHRRYATIVDYAENFYEFLREADRVGASEVWCEAVDSEGLGRALADRMQRAAGLK